MHQRYRDKIKQHFVELVVNIEPDVLTDLLLAKRALKKEEVDKILADRLDSKHTNRLLLFRILKKNDTVYHQFVECMEFFHLKHLFTNSGNGFRNHSGATVFHEADVQPNEEELSPFSYLTLNNRDTIESPDLNTTSRTESNRTPLIVNVKLSKTFQEVNCDTIYDTKSEKRGQVLVINNRHFNPKYHKERRGSEIDLQCIRKLFEQMYMKVEFHEDLDKSRMEEVIQQFSKFDEDKISDICVVVIMSHGEEIGNELVVVDKDNKSLKTSWIEEQFSNVNCTLFSGKPKVFLYQFCRGKRNDYATTKQEEDVNQNNIEPVRSEFDDNQCPEDVLEFDSGFIHKTERRLEDILVGYATQKGHRAHRDPLSGSWYIQKICEVFMEKAHNTHIVEMLNEVDRKLKLFSSPEYTMQTSSYTSNGFNKFLYFNPGIYIDESGNVQKLL